MKRTIRMVAGTWTVPSLALAALLLLGCDAGTTNKAGASSAAPSAKASTAKTVAVESSAVKQATDACGDYVKALEECIAKQEGDLKKTWQAELESHQKAFKDAGDAAKTQMEQACVTGMAAVKQGCE